MSQSKPLMDAFSEHQNALLRFLQQRLGCPDTANDILQKMAEKFLKLHEPSNIDNQRAYLYQTARNEVIDHFRREQRRASYEAHSAQIQGELDHRNAERVRSATDSLEVLQSALEELPELSREIVYLYRIEGLKQKQIAHQLKLNLSTVEKHLSRALKHCRKRLQQIEHYGL